MVENNTDMATAFATALGKYKESKSEVKNLVQTVVGPERPVNIGPLITRAKRIARQYKSWAGESIQNPKVLHDISDSWVTLYGMLKVLEQQERIQALREFAIAIVDFDPSIPGKINKKQRAYLLRIFTNNDPHLAEISKLKGFSGGSPLAFALMGVIKLADFNLENTQAICAQIQQFIDTDSNEQVTIADIWDSYLFNTPLQVPPNQ